MTGFFGAGGMGGNVERDFPRDGTVDFTKPVRIKDKPELDVRVVDTTYIADQAMRAFVLVVITNAAGNDVATLYDENGKQYDLNGKASPSGYTLENAPEKIVQYLNMYDGGAVFGHATREFADENAGGARIACVRVEFEEGQYDD